MTEKTATFTKEDFEMLETIFGTISAVDFNNDLEPGSSNLHNKLLSLMNKFKEK